MKNAVVFLSNLLLVFCFIGEAGAYYYWECGGNNLKFRNDYLYMRTSPVSFPADSTQRSAFVRALISWHVNPSRVKLGVGTDNSTVGINNGQNEAWAWDPEDYSELEGNRAITNWIHNCGDGTIDEADVIFNTEEPWTFSRQKSFHAIYAGSGTSLEAVAVHELGHAVGLDHETRTYTIMYGLAHGYVKDGLVHYYPGENAVHGAVFLYGLYSTRWQDMGAVHWKIIPGFGIFRTVIYDVEPTWDPTDLPEQFDAMLELVDGFVAWRDIESEPRFIVAGGQQVWPEFTYENNGADSQSVQLGYYVSDDENITTSDRRIGGSTFTLARGWPYTRAVGVNLPTDLVEGGDYYLGVIIDEDDQVDEFVREFNNAAYTGIRVGLSLPWSVRFLPMYVTGGNSTIGTVSLNGTAPPGGLSVILSSSPSSPVTVPASVVVPAGSNSATFTVETNVLHGTGYQRIDVQAIRVGSPRVAEGALYVKRQDFSDQNICDVQTDLALCKLCEQRPEGLFCGRLFKEEEEPAVLPWDEIRGIYKP